MKILNFGSCNIDYVYAVDHIVTPGETLAANGLSLFPGGKGLNQSIAAARAGADVYHAGCVGADGEMLREILADSGVDVSYLRHVDAQNGHAVIQVSGSGENSIFLYPGSNVMLTKEYVDAVLADFSTGDIVLVQNETNLVGYILEAAHARGMQTVCNPSPFCAELAQMDLNKITYLVLNEIEARGFSGTDDPEESISYFRRRYPHLKVMLTLGKRGCVYADADRTVSHPAFSVKAVDTTAAGDTFTGYFLAALAKKQPYDRAVKTASAAAALAVTKKGAAPSIPTWTEVEQALRGGMV